jgi:5'-3' exonuclease
MGVPGFFAWLLRNYRDSNIILTKLEDKQKVDILYFDANCLFHPQCHKVLDFYKEERNINVLESNMIKRILNYLDYIIELVNPKEVFISVDGVAPMAKIIQQRKRRYRAIDDNKMKDKIKKKYKIKFNNRWNNTVITPGTEFMETLHQELMTYIKKQTRKTTYSSYHVPGEGEHKILEDIRKDKKNIRTRVIYGLDADLIFLALASGKDDIYLLRESRELGLQKEDIVLGDVVTDVAEMLNYVSVDEMKVCFNDKINSTIEDLTNRESRYTKTDFTDDFIFLCYFLGNDFLPHLPSVDIKTGGLDFLVNCYVDTFLDLRENIITRNKQQKVTVSNIFVKMLVNAVAKNEDFYFLDILPRYQDQHQKKSCFSSNPYEIEMWELENLKNVDVYDPVKLGYGKPSEWRNRYYTHYFDKDTQKLRDTLSLEYLRGVNWVTKYYFEGCPSWEWYYPYSHAPFVSDISDIYSRKKFNINAINFDDTELRPTLTPCMQLLTVLPPTCSNLLPKAYRNYVTSKQSPLYKMFPSNVPLDLINKDALWKCVPMLPPIDIGKIKATLQNITLTKQEQIRNNITSDNCNYK